MRRYRVVGGFVLMALAAVAHGGNGLNDIGYGSESGGMAGADIALARDSASFNTNPAGAVQIQGQVMDILIEPYSYLSTKHSDSIGNNEGPKNKYGSGAGGGYARRLKDRDVVVGFGLFVQGGAGFVYEDFTTPFGTEDTLSGLFGAVKIAPGISWKINEAWSVGASTGLLHSTARQKFFPKTSTPDIVTPEGTIPGFSGFRVDALSGVSANIKTGFQYRPNANWVLAGVYTSKGPIRLENGEVEVNIDGLGVVTYRDARQTGLAFAPEVSLGALYRPRPKLQLVADVTWLEWSSAMREVRLSADDPDNAGAPSNFEVVSPLDWDDQILLAFGATYQWSPALELRGGVSWAENPVPASTINPTFALIGETSISAGFSYALSPQWQLNLSGTYQPVVEVKYDSPPTGASKEKWEVTGWYITFSRRW